MTADVTRIDHPLVQHKLSMMRDQKTGASDFRRLMREVGMLLAYEVTRDLELTMKAIETPLGPMDAPVLAGKKLCLAPILRAGLPLPETSLREAAPDVLDRSVAAATTRFARTPIAPGGSLRFEAIVAADELPERASRALLEVAEPRPAPARRSAPAAPVSTAAAASGPPTETGQAERSSP